MQENVSDAKYIRVLKKLHANQGEEIIRLTGRIQSLHADLDLFAKEKAALKEENFGRGLEIAHLKEENEKFRLGMQENCELRRHIEDYRDMNREQGNMIDDLLGFRQEYQLHVSSLEDRIAALKADNESLKAWTDSQMKQAEEKIKELNKIITNLQDNQND